MSQDYLRYEWNMLPWRKLEASVFKLQKRIYQASERDDSQAVRKLQRLLLSSTSAKLLAVRKVTQDNQGKKTAGVDSVTALTPHERSELAETLHIEGKSKPVRRVWIPKPGKDEKRPLGIPTLRDRARQALVKLALEPEWEAKFEPNSYGFRLGRSCHDAIEAIFGAIKNKTVYVLDADISGCFDNIDQTALLDKLKTKPTLRRVIKGWLKAGVMDNGVFQEVRAGTPQGGVISPLLANIALHGMEYDTKQALTDDLFRYQKAKRGKASYMLSERTMLIARYADDFVILHENEEMVEKAKSYVEEWLHQMGLELKPSKTRMTHTLQKLGDEKPGFQFLGFDIRQHPTTDNIVGFKTLIQPSREGIKRHNQVIRDTLRQMRGAPQEAVIRKLNPIVKGWSRYYTPGVSRKAFEYLDDQMHRKLWRWAVFRHSHKGEQWIKRKYFRKHGGNNWRFATHDGRFLMIHADHKIKRHIKVKGKKTPYDGDWVYWSKRMRNIPDLSPRVAKLLQVQDGRCQRCHHWFKSEDLIEVHHMDQNRANNKVENLKLLHRHCHDNEHNPRYV